MGSEERYILENEIGLFIHAIREAKDYSMKEICDGICSVSTLSRIEAGKKIVDFLMIEALLDRMKLSKSEYEFILDKDDYCAYKQREEIEILIKCKEYEQAEKNLEKYEKENGEETLHKQFIFFQRALMERVKNQFEKERVIKLFLKAISVTAPNFRKKFMQRENLSNVELSCITEMIVCIKDSHKKEESFEELYDYFKWCRKREGLFPESYRFAMQYYAECLYENKKFKKCIQICNEVLEELYETSKVDNRANIFYIRAKAQEKQGFKNKEERECCLKDFLITFYLIAFYDGEEQVKDLKQYIEEIYGWQFIN